MTAAKIQKILICISASPSSARVIRAAARSLMPGQSCLYALYVSSDAEIPEDPGLLANIALARQYGADLHTAEGDDVALTIAEFAGRYGITDLYIGQSASSRQTVGRSIPERIAAYLPETDIHIIPDRSASAYPQMRGTLSSFTWQLRDLLILAGVMTAATLVCAVIDRSSYSNSNIVTVYILAVLIVSVLTSHRYYGIAAGILYILLFNFLFIEPRFTMLVYDSNYLVTYLVSITAALITGSLASRLKNIAGHAAENAYQAGILLDTSNRLEAARTAPEMITTAVGQLSRLLKRPVFFYEDSEEPELAEAEKQALHKTREENIRTGAYTRYMPECRNCYLRIFSQDTVYGCLAVDMQERAFNDFENSILMSIINEFTLALEKERIERERKEAELEAAKEHFKAGLLRSISHDLRTPLTSIYGNVNNLTETDRNLSEEDRQKIYGDLRSDSLWLKEQMENILTLTRLETDTGLRMSAESVEDVIAEAVRHADPHIQEHILQIHTEENLFAHMDAGLIVQVMVNLVNNAVKYTPQGSEIVISAARTGKQIIVTVSDNGSGIPDAEKAHIFELYYTGSHTPENSSRSMGIGLNLCKTILEAHGQKIEVLDNEPHGAVFRFTLEAEDIPYA